METLDDYQVFRVPMTSMTVRATEGIDGITARDAARSKNLFALGWSRGCTAARSTSRRAGSRTSSPQTPAVHECEPGGLRAGYNFGETGRAPSGALRGQARPGPPGTYRSINGTGRRRWG